MAQTQLPPLFGNHMVLQRGMPVPVWGQDKPGQAVTVSVVGKLVSAQTGSDGQWKAVLPPLKAGGPYELMVQGSTSVTLNDVWVGEVWVASGQSNMELPLDNTNGSADEIPKANDPQIRWFVQERRLSNRPLWESHGSWQVCTSETSKQFSAAAYYFAKKLRAELKVPVGILGVYWGGTWIESWIPQEAFETDPAIKHIWESWLSQTEAQKKTSSGLQDMEMWVKNLRFTSKDPAQKPLTLVPSPAGGWSSNAQPGSTFTFKEAAGVGHILSSVQTGGWGNCTTPLAPGGAAVNLGAYDTIEFDAKGQGKFNMLVEQPIVTDWDNYGSEQFFLLPDWHSYRFAFSSLKKSGWGKVEPFHPSAVNAFCVNACVNPMGMTPVALYNAMVNPLVPYGMRGVIWYQGETNVGRSDDYANLLQAMIRSWRKAWGEGDFPFLFAQLPNWHDPNAQPGNGWPELREAQAAALAVTNTGMAVLIDVGESNNVHPKRKAEVGDRLAFLALHVAYGKTGPYCGPLFESLEAKGGKLRVKFAHADQGLTAKGYQEVLGFEVEGENGVFGPATAKIEGKEVVVWSDQVAHPKGVRYAWADDPLCNLYNGAGLPAAPFRAEVKP